MRAAFISVSFLVLVRSSSILDTGGRQRSVPGDKCGYCSLCNFNVLLNVPGAGSNGADYASVEHDGYAAAEDDNLAGITFLNAEQRLPRLRQARQIGGGFVEYSRCHRLIDGKVDAADERAILAHEGQQVATRIDHRDVVGDPQTRGLRLGGRQHALRIFKRKAGV